MTGAAISIAGAESFLLVMLKLLAFAYEAGAVENYDQRTSVMQYRGKNRIQPTKRCRAQAADDEEHAE